jgi:F-type H+-transporting ATPase subunit delta
MGRSASARRYAQALFELATTAGKVDEWRRDLGTACEMASNEAVARAIDSPAVPLAQRRDALARLLGPRVAPPIMNLAVLLASRSRFAIMPDVSSEYDGLVRQSRGIVAATVTSVWPLSDEELEAVKTKVEQLAGATVELYQETNPALIGGVCVKIGDLQIDSSVANRLMRLRRELVQGAS